MILVMDEAIQHAWDTYETPAESIPTSFSPAELRMLAWLAERAPAGGEIVDLGSFLGAGAVSLATGLERGGRCSDHDGEPRIKCYGDFTATRDPHFLSLLGSDIRPGQSYFAKFVANVPPSLRRFIDPLPGELAVHATKEGPITLLIDNASESPSLSAIVVAKFLRRCALGGVFVQRHVNFGWHPWVHLVAALARPALTPLADCGSSRLWAVSGSLSDVLKIENPWFDLSPKRRLSLLEEMMATERPYTAAMVELSRALTVFLDGEVDVALQALTPRGFSRYADPFVAPQVEAMHEALAAFGTPEAFWEFRSNLATFGG